MTKDLAQGEALDIEAVYQNLRTVATSPTWADLPEILQWYQRDVSRLIAEVERLRAHIDAFDRTDHDREGASVVWYDCYRVAQAEVERLRRLSRGQRREDAQDFDAR